MSDSMGVLLLFLSGISYDGSADVIRNGPVTAVRYRDECWYLWLDFTQLQLAMIDNTTPRRARVVNGYLHQETIKHTWTGQ
jgi:hypothetical protein